MRSAGISSVDPGDMAAAASAAWLPLGDTGRGMTMVPMSAGGGGTAEGGGGVVYAAAAGGGGTAGGDGGAGAAGGGGPVSSASLLTPSRKRVRNAPACVCQPCFSATVASISFTRRANSFASNSPSLWRSSSSWRSSATASSSPCSRSRIARRSANCWRAVSSNGRACSCSCCTRCR